MKTGLHGRHGNFHDIGDLLIGAAFELVEDEHSSLFLGERRDRLSDDLSHLIQRPGGLWVVAFRGRNVRPFRLLALVARAQYFQKTSFPIIAVEVPTAVYRYTIDPGGDAAIVPERPGRPEDLKKDVLGNIFGILRVAEEAGTESEDPALILIDEGLESPKVLGGDPPEQFSVLCQIRRLDFDAPLVINIKLSTKFRHRTWQKLAILCQFIPCYKSVLRGPNEIVKAT